MAAAIVLEGRLLLRAEIEGDGAARVEAAAGRRVQRAGDVALQDDAVALVRRVRDGDGRHQGLSIGMERISICLLYTSPSPRDRTRSRMPSSA